MVVYTSLTDTWEAEVGGSGVQDQPQLHKGFVWAIGDCIFKTKKIIKMINKSLKATKRISKKLLCFKIETNSHLRWS